MTVAELRARESVPESPVPRLGGRRTAVGGAVPSLLALGAVLLWVLALRPVDPASLGDVGLAPARPLAVWAAPALLSVAFVVALARRAGGPFLLLLVVALVVMLQATAAAVEPEIRGFVSYRHLGIIDTLSRTSELHSGLDAYFDWPGFFAAMATLDGLAGGDALRVLAHWSAPVLGLLYLPPVLLITRALTSDRRLRWTAVWLFCLGNWVDQDYLSPQGFALLLLLSLLGLLLTVFRPRVDVDQEPWAPSVRTQLVAYGTVVLLVAALAPTHQLTPFAAVLGISCLVAVRRCSLASLPVLSGALVSLWVVFFAVSYLQGHLTGIVSEVGDLETLVDANVRDRLDGSPGHVLSVRLRTASTLLLAAVAVVGAWRRWRAGRQDVTTLALVIAPVALLLVQPYGGEMGMRVWLFALPATAVLAAGSFFPTLGHDVGRATWIALAVVLVALVGGFGVSKYGNERVLAPTTAERAGLEQVYDATPPETPVVAATGHLPWRMRDYETRRTTTVVALWDEVGDANGVVDLVRAEADASPTGTTLVVFSRSQTAADRKFGLLPDDALQQVEDRIAAAPGSRPLLTSHHLRVYEVAGATPGGAP
jgi:hypothetical protein